MMDISKETKEMQKYIPHKKASLLDILIKISDICYIMCP